LLCVSNIVGFEPTDRFPLYWNNKKFPFNFFCLLMDYHSMPQCKGTYYRHPLVNLFLKLGFITFVRGFTKHDNLSKIFSTFCRKLSGEGWNRTSRSLFSIQLLYLYWKYNQFFLLEVV